MTERSERVAARVALVSAIGLTATAVAGSFMRDPLTAIICVTVGMLAIISIGVAYIMVRRP